MATKENFLAAVYLIIRNSNGEILLQRRRGTKLWPGYLALPAGHVDSGEDVFDALIREAKEELNIDISVESIIDTFIVNRKNRCLAPYFDIYFEICSYQGEITIMEPNKCSELVWCLEDALPDDMISFEKEAIKRNLLGKKFSVVFDDNNGVIDKEKCAYEKVLLINKK